MFEVIHYSQQFEDDKLDFLAHTPPFYPDESLSLFPRQGAQPRNSMNLFQACQESLHQTERLLFQLDPVHYNTPHANCFGATLGQHVRHCLNHFEQFLEGVATGRLDYDSRQRSRDIESQPEAALHYLRNLLSRLNHLADGIDETQAVRVKIDCGGSMPCVQTSSLGRELQFLISHTVHHFAIIAIMCNAMGIQLETDFGVAHSTVRHRNSA